MLLKRRTRRAVGAALIALGVVLMVLAPDTVGGWVALGLALLLELVGIAFERRE